MIESEIERMLDNWARWSSGGGLAAHCAVSVYDLGGRGSRAATTMPVIDGEALDIDGIVRGLKFEHEQVLYARYKRELLLERAAMGKVVRVRLPHFPSSFTDEQIAKRLRITRMTYFNRWHAARALVASRYADLRRRHRQA